MLKRTMLIAATALLVSACDDGGTAGELNAAEANALAANATDANMMGGNASLDAVNAAEANGAVDANTANMMQQDLTTNDADTNLANGL